LGILLKHKFLILVTVLILAIIPLVIADLGLNGSFQAVVHVNSTANYPLNGPTAAPTPTSQTVQLSLWTSSGQPFPTTLTNAADFIIMWSSPQAMHGLSVTLKPILVVRNDGATPINVTLSAQNVQVPSNIVFFFCWGPYNASNTVINPGCSTSMLLGFNMAPTDRNFQSGAPFNFSLDLVADATQA
jgi:hypothetical protein